MFDYKKFEDDVVIQIEKTLKEWLEEYDNIYIVSLDCARGMESIGLCANTREYLNEQADSDSEDYWYYKYCEAEWKLYDLYNNSNFNEISLYMREYVEENEAIFTDLKTFEYTEAFDEHCDKIIEACKKALCRFKESIKESFPDLLLTFCISEYLDNKERIEIFTMLNSKEATEEYMEHIEEFN